jgi:hypothetical protein
MTEDEKKALLLAGKMAIAADAVVYDATLYNIGDRIEALRRRLFDYNDHILQMKRSQNAPC